MPWLVSRRALAAACRRNLFGVIPIPLVLVVVIAVIFHFVLTSTRLGRYCYAIGSNIEAARYAGIPVARYQVVLYTILGALTGLAGRSNRLAPRHGQPTAGDGYELRVIAAVVIGGGSLSGGQGTIIGTIIGSFRGRTGKRSKSSWHFTLRSTDHNRRGDRRRVTFDEFQRRRVESPGIPKQKETELYETCILRNQGLADSRVGVLTSGGRRYRGARLFDGRRRRGFETILQILDLINDGPSLRLGCLVLWMGDGHSRKGGRVSATGKARQDAQSGAITSITPLRAVQRPPPRR